MQKLFIGSILQLFCFYRVYTAIYFLLIKSYTFIKEFFNKNILKS